MKASSGSCRAPRPSSAPRASRRPKLACRMRVERPARRPASNPPSHWLSIVVVAVIVEDLALDGCLDAEDTWRTAKRLSTGISPIGVSSHGCGVSRDVALAGVDRELHRGYPYPCPAWPARGRGSGIWKRRSSGRHPRPPGRDPLRNIRRFGPSPWKVDREILDVQDEIG